MRHDDPSALISHLQSTCRDLFNRCLAHGLQPNFAKGKTEILVSPGRKGAATLKRHWFTKKAGMLPVENCSIPWCEVHIIARYSHLKVDTQAAAKSEVAARLGHMKTSLKKYKKTLVTALTIALGLPRPSATTS